MTDADELARLARDVVYLIGPDRSGSAAQQVALRELSAHLDRHYPVTARTLLRLPTASGEDTTLDHAARVWEVYAKIEADDPARCETGVVLDDGARVLVVALPFSQVVARLEAFGVDLVALAPIGERRRWHAVVPDYVDDLRWNETRGWFLINCNRTPIVISDAAANELLPLLRKRNQRWQPTPDESDT